MKFDIRCAIMIALCSDNSGSNLIDAITFCAKMYAVFWLARDAYREFKVKQQ